MSATRSPLNAQAVSNLTIPSEEELREALNNGDVTIEEFQLLLEYFYGSTFPGLQIVAGDLPNLDLIGVDSVSDLDILQQEQLSAFRNDTNARPRKRRSGFGAFSRVYLDQELNSREQSRRVYQFRIGSARGWQAEGSIGSAYGRSALWRSRSLVWRAANSSQISITLGNYDVRWGTGLAFGRRARLLAKLPEFNSESFRTPDRGGFNGATIFGKTTLGSGHTLDWRALGSVQQDTGNRLNTIGAMGNVSLGSVTVGALLGRSTLNSREGITGIRQEQLALSLGTTDPSKRAKAYPLWFNAEVNTQRNSGVLTTALNAEWKYDTKDGNVRGALWHYPRAYRNLTGGGRSGILYESIEIDELGFQFRDRRVNQSGGLLRSVTALDGKNKIETGLEFSKQNRGGASRGDYILAWRHSVSGAEVKLEAGGRTVTSSATDAKSRWRIQAQYTMRGRPTQLRAAVRYLKEVTHSPALGLFARFSRKFGAGSKLELWLDVARFRWWQGGLERFYSYVQYETPLDTGGTVSLITKLVYRYNEASGNPSRVVARLEVRTLW